MQADARHRLLAETLERVFKTGVLANPCGILGVCVHAWRSPLTLRGLARPALAEVGRPLRARLGSSPSCH